jgi:TatD DNase family protein
MIDAHCHLDSKNFASDIDLVIQRAMAELNGIVTCAITLEGFEYSLKLCERYRNFIYLTLGIYPAKTAIITSEELADNLDFIARAKERIVAVGEVGPDFYRVKDARGRERQLEVLARYLKLAEELALPLVIHAREAEQHALEVVKNSSVNVIFHCYSGSAELMKQIIDLGFYVSLSTLVCYSAQHQALASKVDLEHLLVETDSPPLSPFREIKRNEPAFVKMAIKKISEIRDLNEGLLAEITERNTRRAYSI